MPRLAAAVLALAVLPATLALTASAPASAAPREQPPLALLRLTAADGRIAKLGRLPNTGMSWCLGADGRLQLALGPRRDAVRYVRRTASGALLPLHAGTRRLRYTELTAGCAGAAEWPVRGSGGSDGPFGLRTPAGLRLGPDVPQVPSAWSRDGTRVATVQEKDPTSPFPRGELVVVEVATGRELARAADASRPFAPQVTSQAFSPDGTQVVYGTGEAGGLRILDVATGEVRVLRADEPDARLYEGKWDVPAWSPDGSRIAALHAETQLHLLDPLTGAGQPLEPFSDASAGLGGPVWSPDGRSIATTLYGSDESRKAIGVIAAATDARPRTSRLPAWTELLSRLMWTPDSRSVLVVRR